MARIPSRIVEECHEFISELCIARVRCICGRQNLFSVCTSIAYRRSLTRSIPSDSVDRVSATVSQTAVHTIVNDVCDSFLAFLSPSIFFVSCCVPTCANVPMSHSERRASVTTRFLEDILRQRTEMHRTIDYLTGPGHQALEQASGLIRSARDAFMSGIGASWNAALAAGTRSPSREQPVSEKVRLQEW